MITFVRASVHLILLVRIIPVQGCNQMNLINDCIPMVCFILILVFYYRKNLIMSQSLKRPSTDIRTDQDSEGTRWSMASLVDLLDEELEDMNDAEEHLYDSYDRIERAALSEDFARIKLTQYLQGLEDKDDRLVNFPVRVNIELDALEAWKALNPRSGRFEKQDQEVIAKVVTWLDRISLYQIETMTLGISMGPIIATKEQELRQELLPWIAKKHFLDNNNDQERLAEFGGENLRCKLLFDTYARIKLSLIKRAEIMDEIEELQYKINRLTATNRLVSHDSPIRLYITQLQNRLHYLSNARESANYP